MGIFTAPKPAYGPPELPFASTSRRRESSTVGHRRPSFFPAHSAQNIHRDSHTGPISPPLPSPSAVGYFERRPSFFSRPSASSIHHDPPSPGLVHPERRPSFFPRASGSIVHRDSHTAHHRPSDPAITTTVQTTFLGRRVSQAIVPAFMRKASLATAARDRNPSHLRMGETYNDGEDNMADAFYRSRLSVDEVDSEDEKMALQEKIYQLREAKGKEREQGGVRGGWQSKLGWDAAPPKGKKGRNRDPDEKKRSGRKHRQKRVMRELDSDLDAFNVYSQNGLATLTRSRTDPAISIHGSQPSLVSIQESVHSQVTSLAPGPLDNADSILIAEAESRPKAVPVGDGFDALDIMADHIFRIGVQRKKWFKAPKLGMKRDGVATGVSIRAKTGLYRTYPVDYEPLEEFEDAITRLNPEVAIKINSQIVRTIMRTYIDPHISMSELILDANTRIQILDTIPNLARARKHQYAAFIRSEGVLCVWADIVEEIVPAAEALEEALIHFIWRGEEENRKINQAIQIDEQEKKEEGDTQSMKEEEDMDPEDVEMRRVKRHWRERPTNLFAPMIDGMAIMVCLAVIGLGLRTLVVEYALDGQPLRFVLVIFAPALCCVAAFACSCLVGSFWQILGPIRQCTQNSMYYSGIAPKRTMGELSHVTIQMPVYKESLDEVIRPTIESLKRAITTYERQGGSASVIMCDDGLQLLSQEEADERRRFYFDNNIAYCSRPGHNVNGFIRKGRFKKAGNLNYANALSLRIEEVLDELRPDAHAEKGAEHFWSDNDENALYEIALTQVLEEKQGQAWAAGNLRMGSILLIIDSDTRVPEDCFADAVSEMAESPEVAVIQHMSGVMQVAHHFFENGVAHFTRGIQTAISYCCASGEVAPFVGHNAFLRWSALQECMTVDPDDGVRKIWSEDHVSEDFQIAVQLQIKGYVVRWASYTGGEFEEGVSLTCDDEINRWQKYAFGCSELVFHPIKNWWRRGPVTPLYRQFLWSNIPIHSKLTISGYIFSYYAISCAWFLTVVNFFIRGWNIPVDGYYLPSWNVLIVCLVLFGVLSNVAFIVIRYRLKTPDAAEMSFAQIKWIPFFLIFFSGMSMPMSAALASHLVGYNMTWSTTVKTVQKSNFFLQVPLIWKRFWPQLSFFTVMIAGMIVLSQVPAIPAGWQIYSIEVTVPLGMIAAAHILYPFALNPWFLSFSF